MAASTFINLCRLLLLLSILSDSIVRIRAAGIGINYGQIANNLPSHTRVATLINSLNITRIKLYDADSSVLTAFANSNVEFIIGLGNEYLATMSDPNQAQTWIQQHVQPYIGQTKISCIVVGNEVYSTSDTQLMAYVLPAMQSVHVALTKLGLDKQVTVTTAHSFNILSNSYPPSAGAFRPDLASYIQPLLNFQSQINSPIFVNAYPFFAYKGNPTQVPIQYVLFEPNQGITDPITNLKYDNMLYAQIDAVYAAMKAMGHTNIEVRISETGWPSKGDADEVGANPVNAGLYNGNLLKRVQQRQGTPAKPNVPVDVHLFALFNENQKPGPTSERNYGLYYPDESPVYNIGFQQQGYPPEYTNIAYSSSRILAASVLFPAVLLVAQVMLFLRS